MIGIKVGLQSRVWIILSTFLNPIDDSFHILIENLYLLRNLVFVFKIVCFFTFLPQNLNSIVDIDFHLFEGLSKFIDCGIFFHESCFDNSKNSHFLIFIHSLKMSSTLISVFGCNIACHKVKGAIIHLIWVDV